MAVFALPATAVAVAGSDPIVAAVTGILLVPATAGLTRRLARRLRLRPGMVLTAGGLVTADGVVRWDAIDEVAVRNPFGAERVELTVGGRRRKLVLPAGDVELTVGGRRRKLLVLAGEVDLPAAELARLIDRYRRDPQRQRTLIRGAGPPARHMIAESQAGAERSDSPRT